MTQEDDLVTPNVTCNLLHVNTASNESNNKWCNERHSGIEVLEEDGKQRIEKMLMHVECCLISPNATRQMRAWIQAIQGDPLVEKAFSPSLPSFVYLF